MTTAQEKISNGLQGLTSYTRQRISQLQNQRVRSRKRQETAQTPVDISQLQEHTLYKSAPESFRETLEKVGTFSPFTVILGRCDDNIPLLLELNNPAPGSILITGDEGSGKIRLVHSIIKSAVLLNSEKRVKFCVIANETAWFQPLTKYPNCQQILPTNTPEVPSLIQTLAAEEELSRQKGPSKRALILVIDDLPTLLESLSYEQTVMLYRLIKHGPRARIWPVAVLPSNRSGAVHDKILNAFRTRLIGKISSSILAASFAGDDYSPVCDLESGSEFCVPVNGEWVLFKNF